MQAPPLPRFLIPRLPFFYGWVVLGCICLAGFARQGAAVAVLSIFVLPMTEALDWSRTEMSGAVSLGGLLAMQEEPRADDRNQRARAGGAAILVELAAMQRTCLEDGDASAVAQRLDGLVASLPDAADPGLAGVVRLIALRARIEMLRAGRSRDAS